MYINALILRGFSFIIPSFRKRSKKLVNSANDDGGSQVEIQHYRAGLAESLVIQQEVILRCIADMQSYAKKGNWIKVTLLKGDLRELILQLLIREKTVLFKQLFYHYYDNDTYHLIKTSMREMDALQRDLLGYFEKWKKVAAIEATPLEFMNDITTVAKGLNNRFVRVERTVYEFHRCIPFKSQRLNHDEGCIGALEKDVVNL